MKHSRYVPALLLVAATVTLSACGGGSSNRADAPDESTFDRELVTQTACELAAERVTGVELDIDHSSDTYREAEGGSLEARMEVTDGQGIYVMLCAVTGYESIETAEVTRLGLNGELLIG
jgi:hypothetical protein